MSPTEFLVFGINMVFFVDYWFQQDQIQRTARLLHKAEIYYAIDIMANLQQFALLLFAMKLSLEASCLINFEMQDHQITEVSSTKTND